MTKQDMRAVESMIRCGLDFEGVCDSFPSIDRDEIEKVYVDFKLMMGEVVEVPVLKVNCS